MIQVTDDISIQEDEIQFKFIRSSGPGGQNVNKISSAVQLRFDIENSPSLPEDVRKRLIELAGNRLTEQGVLILDSRRYRSQERNRQKAIDRLIELIIKASQVPKSRIETKPTQKSQERRLKAKHERSEIKDQRKSITDLDQ